MNTFHQEQPDTIRIGCLATAWSCPTQPCISQHRPADHPRHLKVKARIKSIYVISYRQLIRGFKGTYQPSLHPWHSLGHPAKTPNVQFNQHAVPYLNSGQSCSENSAAATGLGVSGCWHAMFPSVLHHAVHPELWAALGEASEYTATKNNSQSPPASPVLAPKL